MSWSATPAACLTRIKIARCDYGLTATEPSTGQLSLSSIRAPWISLGADMPPDQQSLVQGVDNTVPPVPVPFILAGHQPCSIQMKRGCIAGVIGEQERFFNMERILRRVADGRSSRPVG